MSDTNRGQPDAKVTEFISNKTEWKREIRNMLNGKREGLLIKYGVYQYLQKLLEKLGNEDSEDIFYEALLEVIGSWQPEQTKDKEYFAIMLELIAAYTPVGGYRKAAKFLEYWENSVDKITDKSGYSANVDLRLAALGALDAYFHHAPEPNVSSEEVSAYKDYFNLLERFLQHPSLGGHAAVILLKSFHLDLADERVKTAICSQVENLYNIMAYVFSVKRENRLEDNLKKLSQQVFSIGTAAIDFFEKRLEIYGVKIDCEQPHLTLTLSNNRFISIQMSDDALDNFKMRKTGLHLLSTYLKEIYKNREESGNYEKIQNILNNCYSEGRDAVLQFKKILDKTEFVNFNAPRAMYSTVLTIQIGRLTLPFGLKNDYRDVWADYSQQDFINLAKDKKNLFENQNKSDAAAS